jgi:hypothetical protein
MYINGTSWWHDFVLHGTTWWNDFVNMERIGGMNLLWNEMDYIRRKYAYPQQECGRHGRSDLNIHCQTPGI